MSLCIFSFTEKETLLLILLSLHLSLTPYIHRKAEILKKQRAREFLLSLSLPNIFFTVNLRLAMSCLNSHVRVCFFPIMLFPLLTPRWLYFGRT